MVGIGATPPVLASPLSTVDLTSVAFANDLRVERVATDGPAAAILPLDALFAVRVAAALRVWRAASGRAPGPDPQALTPQRRRRLALALRALDGRLAHASYRAIAEALFGPLRVHSDAEWQSHDARDRAIRLARLGESMMHGGYRQLLLYPYRRRL